MLYFQIPLNMLPYETKTFLNGKTEPVVLKKQGLFHDWENFIMKSNV